MCRFNDVIVAFFHYLRRHCGGLHFDKNCHLLLEEIHPRYPARMLTHAYTNGSVTDATRNGGRGALSNKYLLFRYFMVHIQFNLAFFFQLVSFILFCYDLSLHKCEALVRQSEVILIFLTVFERDTPFSKRPGFFIFFIFFL